MSVLLIELQEGKDILPAKLNTTSTALFCTVGVGGVKKKSKTIKNSLEPKWGQVFEFDVNPSDLPPCVITLQDKGLFGSTGMGQVTIKTAKKLASGGGVSDSWYPLQPSKSGKAASGALKIKLRVVKKALTVANLQKKKSGFIVPELDLFQMIRNHDAKAVDIYLDTASEDDVNRPEEKTGNTPLHAACLESKNLPEDVFWSLLRFPTIRVDVPNTDKNTPLHYFCAKWQNPDIGLMEELIKKGASVNAANDNGETPIFSAIFNDAIRALLIEKLIEHGANVNILSSFNEGILHYAVRMGRADLVNLILSAAPRLDIKGKDGTPYQLAIQYKHKNIAQHLKKVEELFAWLDENGLGEYKAVFLKNEIFKNLLPDITEGLLDKMEIEGAAARKKILEACKKLEKDEVEADILLEDDREAMDESKAAQMKQELAALPSADASNDWVLDGKELEYLKRLGSGTSGDVYKGLYRGKHVAIKVLKEMTEDKERDEFKKEFHIMSSVHHPNIVHFYGASFKPKLCMVMEYCARNSLFNCLKDETIDIGWDRAIQLMKETTLGINALHTNEPMIMHRDLKSLNLLVTDDWKIKVADFGLSRFDTAEALETLKQMRGTFAYCAPESYFGEKYSPKSDMYSMGIIFWEICHRVIRGKYEQPYSEFKNIQFDFQIIIQAAKSDLRPTIPESCPESLAAVIRACTHKEREKRPTCPDLITMLDAVEKEYQTHKAKWDTSLQKVSAPGVSRKV